MPIWKVSCVDGTFQVADADGALYPLTTGGEKLTRFNEGWSPRGLQTGLPPFHVLELEHTGGDSTIWLHDEALDYRANAVLGLSPQDQERFFAVMEPVIRTLYAECVLAPQAAIPSAAHQFDGMLPRTVSLLIAETIRRIMPGTELVVLDRLQELKAGFGSGPDALSPDWIAAAIEAPSSTAQERFDLPGRQCDRHLDPATGLVFYVMRSDDPTETSLFVPQHKVVLVRSRHTHDPLALLLNYYASHTDRAVVLPEAFDLVPEMVVPLQHGLDEPPQVVEPIAASSFEREIEPGIQGAHESEYHADQQVGHETAHDTGQEAVQEAGRTVFEAPLSETPTDLQGDHTYEEHGHQDHGHASPTAVAGAPLPYEPEPDAGWHDDEVRYDTLPAVEGPAPYTTAPAAPPQPKHNWWQRLLGLGNP